MTIGIYTLPYRIATEQYDAAMRGETSFINGAERVARIVLLCHVPESEWAELLTSIEDHLKSDGWGHANVHTFAHRVAYHLGMIDAETMNTRIEAEQAHAATV